MHATRNTQHATTQHATTQRSTRQRTRQNTYTFYIDICMKPGYWKRIFVNFYEKGLGDTEHDEESVCLCIPDPTTGIGCCDPTQCLNSVTNIECDTSSCPCGEGCRNQKFSSFCYSDVVVRQTDRKGG